jgi:hypothetical protein
MLLWTMYEGRPLGDARSPQDVQNNENGYQGYYICHKVTKSRGGKEKQHRCGKAKKEAVRRPPPGSAGSRRTEGFFIASGK